MFPVKEVPAVPMKGYGSSSNIGKTGHKFIVRQDTGKILSCMTDDYKMVTNEKIIKFAEPIIKEKGGKLKESEIFNYGARSIMKWHFPNEKIKVSNDDILHPEIIIKNSYDGTIGVNIIAGAFRLVCSNGMVVGVVTDAYKNKHSIHNVSLDDIEGIIEKTITNTVFLFGADMPLLIANKINERNIIDFLKMFPLNANKIVTQRLIADRPKTFWDLYNVGTNVTSHHMNRKSESTHKIEGILYKEVKKMALKANRASA